MGPFAVSVVASDPGLSGPASAPLTLATCFDYPLPTDGSAVPPSVTGACVATGRYVVIQMTGPNGYNSGNFFDVCAIQVFGAPTGNAASIAYNKPVIGSSGGATIRPGVPYNFTDPVARPMMLKIVTKIAFSSWLEAGWGGYCTYNNGFGVGSGNVVSSGGFADFPTNTVADSRPWLSIDLGGLYAVTSVQIWARADSNRNGRAAPLAVFVNTTQSLVDATPTSTVLPWTPCVEFPIPQGGVPASQAGACVATGRYVTVQMTGLSADPSDPGVGYGNFMDLCAIQVFGTLTAGPPSPPPAPPPSPRPPPSPPPLPPPSPPSPPFFYNTLTGTCMFASFTGGYNVSICYGSNITTGDNYFGRTLNYAGGNQWNFDNGDGSSWGGCPNARSGSLYVSCASTCDGCMVDSA